MEHGIQIVITDPGNTFTFVFGIILFIICIKLMWDTAKIHEAFREIQKELRDEIDRLNNLKQG